MMDISKEYRTKIDSLSDEIVEAIAKTPGLPRTHHCPLQDSQESMAIHIEWLMATRDTARKNLARFERAKRRAISNLS